MALKLENVSGGKFKHNGTTYTMVEAKYRGAVVWPTSSEYTYTFSNITRHYNKYPYAYICAAGDTDPNDFCYLTGDVEIKKNGVHYETKTGVYLTISSVVGGGFYIDTATVGGTTVSVMRAQSLGTTVTGETYGAVYVTYGASSPYYFSYYGVKQEANAVTNTSSGTTTYGEPYLVPGTESGYYVDFRVGAYTDSSNPCPASGGSTSIYTKIAIHQQTQNTPWECPVTYTYTSGAENTITATGEETSTVSVNDPYTIERTSGSTAFTINNEQTRINIANCNEHGNLRSATFTLRNSNNSSAYSSITLYQQMIASYTYSLQLQDDGVRYEGGATSSTGIHPTSGIDCCEFVCNYKKLSGTSVIQTTTVTATPVCSPYFVASGTKLYYNYDEHKGNGVNEGNYTATLSYGSGEQSASTTSTFKFAGNYKTGTNYLTTGVTITGTGSSDSNPIHASGGTIPYTGGLYKQIDHWSSGWNQEGNISKISFNAAVNSANNSFTGHCTSSTNEIIIPSLSATPISSITYYAFSSTTPVTNMVSFKAYQGKNEETTSGIYGVYSGSTNIQTYNVGSGSGTIIVQVKRDRTTRYTSGEQISALDPVVSTAITVTYQHYTGANIITNAYLLSDHCSVYVEYKSGTSSGIDGVIITFPTGSSTETVGFTVMR